MDGQIVVGIDLGTTKVCTLVAREDAPGQLRILGVGVEPSRGMRKGVVVDLETVAKVITHSVDKAERTSGIEITSALVSLAGSNVSSENNRGVVGVSGRIIDQSDVARAVDAARAVTIPHNREIVNVIQRGFTVDGQNGIRSPIGMHGYRLEVETHLITASSASVENVRQCVESVGIGVESFVLNPLASAEVSLTETERQMGVVICDIGGGTTDMAIYVDGDVWYTAVLAIGGNHITSDIAQGLRLPLSQAEEIKIKHGRAGVLPVDSAQYFNVKPFGEQEPIQISLKDLMHIINARVEEIFSLVVEEIKHSGYDGLLPAGLVITGGTSNLPGIRTVAGRVMGLPVRIAKPTGLIGMTDQLNSPAYSTSIGLLQWALMMNEVTVVEIKQPKRSNPVPKSLEWEKILEFLRRMLP